MCIRDRGMVRVFIQYASDVSCYLTEEFSWDRNGWRVVWGSRGQKTGEWVGEGSSEGFVEGVFELKADVFIWGNGKMVGNKKDNWAVDWKVRKLWDRWHEVRGQDQSAEGERGSEAFAYRLSLRQVRTAPRTSLRADVWIVSAMYYSHNKSMFSRVTEKYTLYKIFWH